MSATSVSIVLPTRNGAATLPALLDAIARQHVDFPFEVVAVDSASTDGTLDLLHTRVDQVLNIAADAFDHGLTRNLAIEQARGELIVLMAQDALPVSSSWLASLTSPLLADARVAGAFARQRPRADASALTRHYLDRWVGSSAVPRTVRIDDRAEFEALEPMAQLERCTFDNVCSCIRRSVWADHPFRPTAIAEDLAWAKEVLLAGYQLTYVPAAEVVHSHDRPVRYELARTYTLHRELYHLFRLRTIPTLPLLMRAIISSLAVHLRCQKNVRAVALAFAWPIGQYLGALAAINGWKPSGSRGA